jgi:hypothetical protein
VNGQLLLKFLLLLSAIPAGAFSGFLLGYYLWLGILLLIGEGKSHDDIYACLGAAVVGATIGVFLLTRLVWVLVRRLR